MGRLVLTIDGPCDQTLSRRNGIAAPVDATRKWRAAGNRLARSGIQMVLETAIGAFLSSHLDSRPLSPRLASSPAHISRLQWRPFSLEKGRRSQDANSPYRR